jgi:hypothetical protein
MLHLSVCYALLTAACLACPAAAFREWNYSITGTDSSPLWSTTWKLVSSTDAPSAPRPRRGHSLVVAGNQLILFGGRGNEADAVHIPRTYNVKKVCTMSRSFVNRTHSLTHSLTH